MSGNPVIRNPARGLRVVRCPLFRLSSGGGSTRLMILNPLSVFAAFAAVLRVVLGVVLVVAAVRAWRREPEEGERRYYFVALCALGLLGISVLAWPLHYAVLQSYVPQWAGIMCIQGVQRIGEGSVGTVSLLPTALSGLEFLKPALVFAAGAWLVLHRSQAAAPRLLGALLAFGGVAILDGGIESFYLFVPNKENVVAAGCCMAGTSTGMWSKAGFAFAGRGWNPDVLTVAFFAVGAATVFAIGTTLRRISVAGEAGPGLRFAVGGSILAIPVGLAFLGAVAAPSFLGLSQHHCVYCLIAAAPESVVAIALFVIGAFSVGWAAMVHALGGEEREHPRRRALHVAWFCFAGALGMALVRLIA